MTSHLDELRTEIDLHIATRLDELPGELGVDISTNGQDVYERLREFGLRPGKRIRGALAMVAYDMFGGRKPGVALEAALAVELIQNYLLIVDDVMDRSAVRRGGPTLHRQYEQLAVRNYPTVDAEHFANMVGINAGLIDHHLSMLVLSRVHESPERVVRAIQLFQTNIAATGFGQMDDLFSAAGQDLTLQQVEHLYLLKSSSYSFVNPLQIGAVLAGADEAVLGPIKVFGERAGLAFQLQDDLLGMFGDEASTGKSSLDDLREGKLTMMMRHALAHADARQLRTLHAALGNPRVTRAGLRAVQAILEDTGSRAYMVQQMHEAVATARGVLDAQAMWDPKGKEFLTGLLDYVITRRK